MNLDAIETNVQLQSQRIKMSSALKAIRILTFVAVSIVYLAYQVKADLAPREDDEVEGINNIKAEIHEDDHQSTTQAPITNLGFIHAFIASFSVIIVSEIGDKTFFIAAIMSMVCKINCICFVFLIIALLCRNIHVYQYLQEQ